MLTVKTINCRYQGQKYEVRGAVCERCGILASGIEYPDGYTTNYAAELIRFNDLDLCQECIKEYKILGKRKFFKDYRWWVKNLPLRRREYLGYVYKEVLNAQHGADRTAQCTKLD